MTPRTAPPLAARVLAAAVALCATPGFAAEAPADAPTATAPAGPDLSVADQIAAYLRDSPVARLPADEGPPGVTGPARDRKPHGFVDVAVGSHGYRSVYVRSDLPIGETGMLSIGVGESRGGRGLYGGPYGPGDPRGQACRGPVGIDAERPCLAGARLMEPHDSPGETGRPPEPPR